MFETQKSRNKTSSGDIGLNIRTLASPEVGQDQVSGGVSVLCWHAAPVANALWKPLAIRLKVKFGYKVNAIGGRRWDVAAQEWKVCNMEIKIVTLVVKGSVKLTVPID